MAPVPADEATQKQHPIGSGFTAASTADEVVAGTDLSGKNVIVTGGHSGLGLEAARALSKAGASVTVGARDPERAAAALAGIGRVGRLDLVDPMSVDAFAAWYLDSGRPLHILINNAGLMGGPLVRDARGCESQFATNHLGHFQLTQGLLPALRAAYGARVVTMSSGAIGSPTSGGTIRTSPLATTACWPTASPRRPTSYSPSSWTEEGIRGYAVHPGIVLGTNVAPWQSGVERRAMGLIDDAGQPVRDPDREMKTPQQGASTMVFAATSPLLADVGGVYLKDNDVGPLDDPSPIAFGTDEVVSSDVVPHAIDPPSAQRLWELSERLLTA